MKTPGISVDLMTTALTTSVEARRGEAGLFAGQSRRAIACCFLAILLVGIVLRFIALDVHSFWFDEVVAMRVSRAAGLGDMVQRLRTMDKVNAPLHPLLLMGWTSLWGSSELAARSLSALFSTLSLMVLPWTAWQATRSRSITLVAALMFAVCPLDLHHAVENRMYSILSFWTVLAWGFLFSFRYSISRFREVAFAICLILMAYTHPLGGLMVIALALGYAVDRVHSKLTWPRWLTIQLVAFLAILPWAGHYMDHSPDPKESLTRLNLLYSWMARGLGLPLKFLPVVLGLGAIGWWAPARWLKPHPGGMTGPLGLRRRTSWVLICWLTVPGLLMSAYTILHNPILGPIRYHTNQMPALVILSAGALYWRPRLSGFSLLFLVFIYTVPSLWKQVYDPQTKPDWREATRQILLNSPEPLIVLGAREPHMYYYTVDYYLPPNTPVLSLETYRQRQRAGEIGAGRSCWLLHDRLDRSETYLESSIPDRISSAEINLGRLRAMRLDSGLITALGEVSTSNKLRR